MNITISSDRVVNGSYVYLTGDNNVKVQLTTDDDLSSTAFQSFYCNVYLVSGNTRTLVKQINERNNTFTFYVTVATAGTYSFLFECISEYQEPGYSYANDPYTVNSSSFTVTQYTTPSITTWSGIRCNSAGVESATGTYVKVKASVTAPNSTPTITMKSKVKGAISYSKTQTLTNNAETIISGYDTSSSYVFDLFVTDNYGASLSRSFEISTQPVLVDFKAGGTGMAIGKVAETDNLFEVALPTKFNGNVVVQGTLEGTAANSARLGGNLPSAFAPSGFGLGEQITTYLSNANNAVGTGFYRIDGSTTNGLSAAAVLIHHQYDENFMVQTATIVNGEIHQRVKLNGSWGAWRFIK